MPSLILLAGFGVPVAVAYQKQGFAYPLAMIQTILAVGRAVICGSSFLCAYFSLQGQVLSGNSTCGTGGVART